MRPIDADALKNNIIDLDWVVKEHDVVLNHAKLLDVEKCIDDAPTVPQFGKWVSVKDKLPGAEQTVIVLSQKTDMFTGKPVYWRSMGFYENGKIKESESFCSWCDMEDYLDDSEDPDDPFIPEGWWEDVNYSEKFSMIDDKVMAWMPLPPLPKKGNAINE